MLDTVNKFAEHLANTGLAPKTIESYTSDVKQFNAYLKKMNVKNLIEIKRFYVTSFKDYLIEQNYSVASINKKINSLHAYNQYLAAVGLLNQIVVNPKRDRIKVAAGSEREVEVFEEHELTQLLFYIQDRNQVSLRNHVIVNLLLYTGVRVSELCNIKLRDLDYLTATLKVTGKGNKYREIPLRADLMELIKEYVSTERQVSRFNASQYLLLSERAPKLHRDAVNQVLKKLPRKLGFKTYPHKFRHTFCSLLLKKGVPLTTVSKLAGHSSIQTTSAYYISTSRQDKLEAVNLL